MNKRGQFYLVGAIVIVSLIIGFVTITNFTKQDTSTKVYDLSEELGVEANQVLEYGLINQGTQNPGEKLNSLDQLIPDFTNKYSSYISDDKVKLIIIFGDKKGIRVVTYNDVSGSFSYGGETSLELRGATSTEPVPVTENKVTVKIDGVDHVFELQEGQNFYYIISQENPDGSRDVATSNN
jgi:hypothetical protein